MRIGELDGLRCFLSWWVVLNHILLSSGFRYETLPPFLRILARGGYAVDVFIILSGFVITKLLSEKREVYSVYILRRFMRLFPAFAVTILLAIVTRPLLGFILAAGWPPDPVSFQNALGAWNSEIQHFWAHLFVHIPMLHGIIPQALLPFSPYAFVSQAWSISLEWQYYLCAPLFAFIGRRFGPLGWFALAVGAILATLWAGPAMDTLFSAPSFLPQKLLLFLLGGMSYWIFVDLAGKHRDLPWRVFFFIAPTVLWFTLSIPLAIWTAAVALVLGEKGCPGLSRIKAFLNLRGIQRLGAISYSTYLVHDCCIWVAQASILRILPHITKLGMFAGLLATAVPFTLVASEILYRSIESPGIQLGRRLTRNARG